MTEIRYIVSSGPYHQCSTGSAPLYLIRQLRRSLPSFLIRLTDLFLSLACTRLLADFFVYVDNPIAAPQVILLVFWNALP